MSKSQKLKDMVPKHDFLKVEQAFRKHVGLGLETTDTDGYEVRQLCSSDCHPEFCRQIRESRPGSSRCREDRRRSLTMAFETGQPYISICHAGLVLVCVPIMEKDTPLGGLFFAKCLSEPVNEVITEDIIKRLRGLRPSKIRMALTLEKLPVCSARQIHEAAEFLFILFYEITGLDPRVVKWRREKADQQAQISEYIQESKKVGPSTHYPYKSERKLISKVKIGDRTGAKEILNSMLAEIIIQNPGQLSVLKARLVELLSILSRAAVEGGVDINDMLKDNLVYIEKIMNIDTQDELCAWAGKALDEFTDKVYANQDDQKMTQIKPAIEHMKMHFDRTLSLAEIAKAAHLSVSRLAHIFKEQMGMTIVDYLTSLRIDYAKRLLLGTDESCTMICYKIGYNNQSYFTRTFKTVTGMTPRQFREKNKRPPNPEAKGKAS
ncbi:HTH-type transcriptional regulator YesS [Anaerohalosphaera lusitana]|uniref:HTH-type transcriptional regulator YesS n=1 Tax=Anaerohalosphaera lusitana TaxID=1936003 RepID=A0A1U9NPT5_9BACT|nr:helix-turn-helix domain-containing protein [Anaerohalosphaera lusitana]AQT69620.1 HTH-type transcriptional regulator YesS [Anaerohalosphaera lusitana]